MSVPKRILIVDDYPDAALIACELFEMLGHTCRSETSGAAALVAMREFEPDLVVLDIGLPDISGYDLAPQLRAIAGARPVHITALTGWGQPRDRERSAAAGFDHHVVKPADITKLRGIVEHAAPPS